MNAFPVVQAGDVLAYWRTSNFTEELIDAGEVLEDGPQEREYFHVALALNSTQKIESLTSTGVGLHKIIYDGSFDVFKVPMTDTKKNRALNAALSLVGERYNWWAVVDDGLRYLSGGKVHLPKKFIDWTERYTKECSGVLFFAFRKALWKPALRINAYPPPSPQDVVDMLKPYQKG